MKRLIVFASIMLAAAVAGAQMVGDEPRAPGRGGTGAAGVPGKGELGTGAPDPSRAFDGYDDADVHDGETEDIDRESQAGDAPAGDAPADEDDGRYQSPGNLGTGGNGVDLRDPSRGY